MLKMTKNLMLIALLLGVMVFSACIDSSANEKIDVNAVPPIDTGASPVVSTPTEAGVSAKIVSPAELGRAQIIPPADTGATRGIVVSGQGSVTAKPDIAMFTAGVVTTGATAEEALAKNSNIMDAVVKAIKDSGVAEKDLKTQSVSVWPEIDYGYRDDQKREMPIILGYRAENTVAVTVRALPKTGALIDAATKAGANQVYGVSFTLSPEASKSLRVNALKEAVMDASDKAKAIADALGIEKITPLSVSESSGYYPVYRSDAMAMEKAAGAPTPVSPGEVEVTASVTITFDFES